MSMNLPTIGTNCLGMNEDVYVLSREAVGQGLGQPGFLAVNILGLISILTSHRA